MSDESKFAELDAKLTEAVKILDGTCDDFLDLDFSPKENIGRIGHALVWIFEIQGAIYDRYPALTPEQLKELPRWREKGEPGE